MSHALSPEERRALISQFRQVPNTLTTLVANRSAADLTARALPGEWTVAQVLHHLADAHMHAFLRFKAVVVEDNPVFKPYDQEAWAATADACAPSVADSLAILSGLHARWALLMESLDEGAWMRSGTHPELGPFSLENFLTAYVAHSENHRQQIITTLAALDAVRA